MGAPPGWAYGTGRPCVQGLSILSLFNLSTYYYPQFVDEKVKS